MVRARFKEGDTMSDPVGIAGDRIRSDTVGEVLRP
jgi:hypothetical protein